MLSNDVFKKKSMKGKVRESNSCLLRVPEENNGMEDGEYSDTVAYNFLELVERYIVWVVFKIPVADKQYKYYLNTLSRDLGTAF